MSNLFKKDRVPMKEIAERIGRDKSTVTSLVNKLVDAGFVVKESDPDDKRITCLCLTARGRSLENDFDKISERLIATAFRSFSQKEREELVRGIVKMLNNFD